LGAAAGAKGIARLKAKADAHAANILPVIEAIRAEGKTSGVLTPNGGQWWATSVRNLLNRAQKKQ